MPNIICWAASFLNSKLGLPSSKINPSILAAFGFNVPSLLNALAILLVVSFTNPTKTGASSNTWFNLAFVSAYSILLTSNSPNLLYKKLTSASMENCIPPTSSSSISKMFKFKAGS